MQVQGTDSLVPVSSRYSGPADCALKTIKTEGVRQSSIWETSTCVLVIKWHSVLQVTGIFRGGFTTLLRESIGNAVFFSVYENVRYYMHSQLHATTSVQGNFMDMGIGILTGGLGGVAVSFLVLYSFPNWWLCLKLSYFFLYNNGILWLLHSWLIFSLYKLPSSGQLFCPWMLQKL